MAELFGVPVSPGAVSGMVTRITARLDPALEAIRSAVAGAEVAHFDETGFRVAGKLAWVHSASAGNYALITVHPKRGTQGMDAAGVLPEFSGIAVHDAWAPYDTYPGVAGHSLCNAHALRELQAVTDASPPGQWCWAAQAADALRQMKDLAGAALAVDGTLNGTGPGRMAAARHEFRSAVLIGQTQTAARAGPLMRKHHALARRLREREDDYLRFTADPRAPFDNNAAERSARSGWENCGSRSPGACDPWPAPRTSAPSAPTCPPPRNTASASSTPSPKRPPERPGSPLRHDNGTGHLSSYERST